MADLGGGGGIPPKLNFWTFIYLYCWFWGQDGHQNRVQHIQKPLYFYRNAIPRLFIFLFFNLCYYFPEISILRMRLTDYNSFRPRLCLLISGLNPLGVECALYDWLFHTPVVIFGHQPFPEPPFNPATIVWHSSPNLELIESNCTPKTQSAGFPHPFQLIEPKPFYCLKAPSAFCSLLPLWTREDAN